MKKKIGVVLSGCGVFDGSEIHETVITLLAIDQNGAEAVCITNLSSCINKFLPLFRHPLFSGGVFSLPGH